MLVVSEARPPAIEPDDKNWTWVLDRPCPECGFVAGEHPRESLGEALRELAGRYDALLADPRVGLRPSPQVWSALEYGCHVRDVYRLYLHRLEQMLAEDDPTFANWDQDDTAVAERYDLQEPAAVRRQLADASTAIAERFDEVTADQWTRTGTRSDGARFTIDTFGVYFLHDPVHHLYDVEQGYAALS